MTSLLDSMVSSVGAVTQSLVEGSRSLSTSLVDSTLAMGQSVQDALFEPEPPPGPTEAELRAEAERNALAKVFGAHQQAHSRIKSALGDEMTASISNAGRRQKQIGGVDSDEEEKEQTREGGKRHHSSIHQQHQQLGHSSSDESSSDEEVEGSVKKHNYALGINPDLPLHHPLNQQPHLHSSHDSVKSPTEFHPISSPPAVRLGGLASFPFPASNTKAAHQQLLHPGLLGIQSQLSRDMSLATSRNQTLVNLSGTGKVVPGTVSASPFISPQLHSQLALHMQNRGPNSTNGASTAEVDRFLTRFVRRQRTITRAAELPRVTGTHQLKFLHEHHEIHGVKESHDAHLEEHAHQLLVPVIRAHWADGRKAAANAAFETVTRDENGDLRTADGELLNPEDVDLSNASLDANSRQFLLSYVQGHTAKHTEEERRAKEAALKRKHESILNERLVLDQKVAELSKLTPEERRREEERLLALKERELKPLPALPNPHTSAPVIEPKSFFNLSDLPELPELPMNYYDLENTFHQHVNAHRQDILSKAASVGLASLKEDPIEEKKFEEGERKYLHNYPKQRWRRSSFSLGHNIQMIASTAKLSSIEFLEDPEDEYTEEGERQDDTWKPNEILDSNLPESQLGEGLSKILELVNQNVPATAATATATSAKSTAPILPAPLLQPSKPLTALTEDERRAQEEYEISLREARKQESLVKEDLIHHPEEGDMINATIEFGDDETDDATAKPANFVHDGSFDADFDSAGRPKLVTAEKDVNESVPEDEREARLEAFLKAKEDEERAKKEAEAAEAKKKEEEQVAAGNAARAQNVEGLQSFTKEVVLPTLQLQLHEARMKQDPKYAAEYNRKIAMDAWTKECRELTKTYELTEQRRKHGLYVAQRSLAEAQEHDASVTLVEDSTLAQLKAKIDDPTRRLTKLRAERQARQTMQRQRKADQTKYDTEEARAWDEDLLNLEQRTKEQHLLVVQLKRQLEDARVTFQAQRDAAQPAMHANMPDEERAAIRAQFVEDQARQLAEFEAADQQRQAEIKEEEVNAETYLQEYETSFESKQQWLKELDGRKVQEAKDAEDDKKEEVFLGGIAKDIVVAKDEFAKAFKEIEAARQLRDAKLDELEAAVAKCMVEPGRLILPPEPKFVIPSETIDQTTLPIYHNLQLNQPTPTTATATPTQPKPAQPQQPQQQQPQQPPVQPAQPQPQPQSQPSTQPTASAISSTPTPIKDQPPQVTRTPSVTPAATTAPAVPTPAPVTPTKPLPSVAPLPSLPPAPVAYVVPTDPNVLIRHLMFGSDFIMHNLVKKEGMESLSSKSVYLWAEFPSYNFQTRNLVGLIQAANFFCCGTEKSKQPSPTIGPDAIGRTRYKEQKLPFSIIEALISGKKTPVLQSVFCTQIADARCFSFGGPRAMVSLEAENEQTKVEWMEGLRAILKMATTATQEAAAKAPPPQPSAVTTPVATPREPLTTKAPTPKTLEDMSAQIVASNTKLPPTAAPPSVPPSPKEGQSLSTTPRTTAAAASTVASSSAFSSPAPKAAAPVAVTPTPTTPVTQPSSTTTATSSSTSASSAVNAFMESIVAPKPVAPVELPTPIPPFKSSLPPILEVSQKFKSTKSVTDSLSLLAYGSVFRLFSHSINTLTGQQTLCNIADYLFYVDFSARSDSRMGSRGVSGANSIAATPRTKNAISPVMQASLYYCAPGKRQKIREQIIYLTDILEVHEGKEASKSLFKQAHIALTNPATQIIPASHCFTLTIATSKSVPPTTTTLTIQCPSLAIRTLFLRGLYEIFERQFDKLKADAQFEYDLGQHDVVFPERVRVESQTEPNDDHLIAQPVTFQELGARAKSPVQAEASASALASPASPRANNELLQLLLDVMSRGEEFIQHSFPRTPVQPGDMPSKRSIFLWIEFPDSTPAANEEEDDIIHSQKGGVVYWCDAVRARGGPNRPEDDKGIHRFIEPGHSFPIDTIHTVTPGKGSQVLIHYSNDAIDSNLCFSFASSQTPPRTSLAQPTPLPYALDLQCGDEQIQQLWTQGLKHILSHQ